jgi:hypothetical protein
MKTISICLAKGTESKLLERVMFPWFILFVWIFSTKIGFNLANDIVDEKQLQFMLENLIVIGFIYHILYVLIPPKIQINSLNWSLFYKSRRAYYLIRLQDIHHFSIAEDAIILQGKKIVKIPVSEFKHIDLISFANIMNQIIATDGNFDTLFFKDKIISGFKYLEGPSMEQLRKQEAAIVNFWWDLFPLVAVIIITMSSSITELLFWYF